LKLLIEQQLIVMDLKMVYGSVITKNNQLKK